MSTPLLQFSTIEKAFFGVKVLKGVSFTVPPDGAVGLVGENGAGKSTLMNILGGNLRAEGGTMMLEGAPFSPRSPAHAVRAGIAFIHQELNLFSNLTVAENLFLTRFPRSGPFIKKRESNAETEKWLREVGLSISPETPVEALSPGQRQLVEIAKALSVEARLIIFDEPTTSLSVREVEHLFALIARLREKRIAFIYISHALPEIFRLCDDIIVLRDGSVVGSGPVRSFTKEKLVSLMIGRELTQAFPEKSRWTGSSPLLEVKELSRRGQQEKISFTLHRGEVLGLGGLMGAGRTELARTIFGLESRGSGTIRLDGELFTRWFPRVMVEKGVAFLTENRQQEGLCLEGSVTENFTLAALREHSRTPLRWLSLASINEAVKRIRGRVDLDAKVRAGQVVRTLSGGNQQKVVLGKWLLRDPRVLILDEPTRGVDVGAKFEIYRLINELVSRGAGILLIASEMEELLGLCHRILVMKSGAIVDELNFAAFDRSRILRAALGENKKEQA